MLSFWPLSQRTICPDIHISCIDLQGNLIWRDTLLPFCPKESSCHPHPNKRWHRWLILKKNWRKPVTFRRCSTTANLCMPTCRSHFPQWARLAICGHPSTCWLELPSDGAAFRCVWGSSHCEFWPCYCTLLVTFVDRYKHELKTDFKCLCLFRSAQGTHFLMHCFCWHPKNIPVRFPILLMAVLQIQTFAALNSSSPLWSQSWGLWSLSQVSKIMTLLHLAVKKVIGVPSYVWRRNNGLLCSVWWKIYDMWWFGIFFVFFCNRNI